MCAVLVVVANILREPAFQVACVNCDDVIQGLSNDVRTGLTFRDRNRYGDFQSVFGITIKDDEPRGGSKWKASRNCWTIHKLVGCFVTLKCRIRRRLLVNLPACYSKQKKISKNSLPFFSVP